MINENDVLPLIQLHCLFRLIVDKNVEILGVPLSVSFVLVVVDGWMIYDCLATKYNGKVVRSMF